MASLKWMQSRQQSKQNAMYQKQISESICCQKYLECLKQMQLKHIDMVLMNHGRRNKDKKHLKTEKEDLRDKNISRKL